MLFALLRRIASNCKRSRDLSSLIATYQMMLKNSSYGTLLVAALLSAASSITMMASPIYSGDLQMASTYAHSQPSLTTSYIVVSSSESLNAALEAGGFFPRSVYSAWCIDQYVYLRNQAATSLYDRPPALLPSSSWNSVAYVLNHKRGSVGDLQSVIWMLLQGNTQYNMSSDALALYDEARSIGSDYTPGVGEIQPLVAYIDGWQEPGADKYAYAQDIIVEAVRRRDAIQAEAPIPETRSGVLVATGGGLLSIATLLRRRRRDAGSADVSGYLSIN